MSFGWNEFGWLVVGTIVGLLAGIAIYWLPLRQFKNELAAIWNLVKKKYKTGDDIAIRSGIDLYPVDSRLPIRAVSGQFPMKIWHDEGVGWHHTHSGWKRVRILHIFDPDQGDLPDVYRACHLDLV